MPPGAMCRAAAPAETRGGGAGEGLHEVAVRDEERDMWSVHLGMRDYAAAARHARTQVRPRRPAHSSRREHAAAPHMLPHRHGGRRQARRPAAV